MPPYVAGAEPPLKLDDPLHDEPDAPDGPDDGLDAEPEDGESDGGAEGELNPLDAPDPSLPEPSDAEPDNEDPTIAFAEDGFSVKLPSSFWNALTEKREVSANAVRI